jgi:hypothetical protein
VARGLALIGGAAFVKPVYIACRKIASSPLDRLRQPAQASALATKNACLISNVAPQENKTI